MKKLLILLKHNVSVIGKYMGHHMILRLKIKSCNPIILNIELKITKTQFALQIVHTQFCHITIIYK